MLTIPGKIPITIHPLFWLIALFIGFMWTGGVIGALICLGIIFVSVLLHEFGHALTSMAFGQKARIELAAFGGFTYRQGRKLKLWEEFIVVLNGPLAGFLLSILAYVTLLFTNFENASLVFALRFTFIANLFWTVINLVPVLPLDGGHLLSIILEAIFGFKGIKMAIMAGLVIAVAISIFFFAFGQFLVGALFLILTFESFRSLKYYKIFTEKDRDTHLQDLVKLAEIDFENRKFENAIEKLEEVRAQTREGILFTLATQRLAEIYRDQKRYDEAYQFLVPIRKNLSGESLSLFHFLAYRNRDYKTVTEIGNKCFQDNPSYNTALINALAYGALEKPEPAVGWLECALREGLPSLQTALEHAEFDHIRQDPKFQQIQDKQA